MGELLYKPDWEEARQRYVAWWGGERMDRCLLTITAPRDNLPDEPAPKRPDDIEQAWTDLDYLDACNDYRHRRTLYAAEAFPVWSPGYPGHVSIPTMYGCPFKLDWETGWHDPILTEPRLDASGLKIDRAGRWWRFGDVELKHAREVAAGKCIPSMHAIFGGGDTLAMLRGNERLLIDLMDDPQAVRETELRLMDDWFEVFDHQTGLLTEGGGDYSTWFPLWSPGRFYPMQCDVSYGISPETFRECFIPALRKHADWLDQSVYHVDGIGAFPLVDELLKIERIGAFQILPGTGKPGPLHYLDILQKVQRAGRRVQITLRPEDVPQALSLLDSRLLCIQCVARSEDQAGRLIRDAERAAR